MQLYFIRHAQSLNNALWDQTGDNKGRSEDPGLTETGQRQVEFLASFLAQAGPGACGDDWDPQNAAGFGFTHLYTSLMVRAVVTGEAIARALGTALVGWSDWHESGGIYLDDEHTGERHGLPGKNRAYFETHHPNLVLPDELDKRGWWNRPFETYPQRRVRARRALAELWKLHGNTQDRVAVVSHGGFYNHFLSALLDLPWREDDHPESGSTDGEHPPAGRWFLMNNAAITRIDFDHDVVRLNYNNRVDFLPPDLIT
jgi:2,3-bisphosphoglycerate-dependent phosphoglycerate mutase